MDLEGWAHSLKPGMCKKGIICPKYGYALCPDPEFPGLGHFKLHLCPRSTCLLPVLGHVSTGHKKRRVPSPNSWPLRTFPPVPIAYLAGWFDGVGRPLSDCLHIASRCDGGRGGHTALLCSAVLCSSSPKMHRFRWRYRRCVSCHYCAATGRLAAFLGGPLAPSPDGFCRPARRHSRRVTRAHLQRVLILALPKALGGFGGTHLGPETPTLKSHTDRHGNAAWTDARN